MRRVEFWAEGKPTSYSRDGARFGVTPAANVLWRNTIAAAYRLAHGRRLAHLLGKAELGPCTCAVYGPDGIYCLPCEVKAALPVAQETTEGPTDG